MTKTEIIAVLKEMLNAWTEGLECDDFFQLLNLELCFGFCNWLRNCKYYQNYDFVIYELRKDLNTNMRNNLYWYQCASYPFNPKKILTPRIKHLERSIARLQNEIANN